MIVCWSASIQIVPPIGRVIIGIVWQHSILAKTGIFCSFGTSTKNISRCSVSSLCVKLTVFSKQNTAEKYYSSTLNDWNSITEIAFRTFVTFVDFYTISFCNSDYRQIVFNAPGNSSGFVPARQFVSNYECSRLCGGNSIRSSRKLTVQIGHICW